MSEGTSTKRTSRRASVLSEEAQHNYDKYVYKYMDALFKSDYEKKEALYVLIGAVIIALNTGFINGVCMSPFFLEDSRSTEGVIDPRTQGVSGTGGSFTKAARFLVESTAENRWAEYRYASFLILSYIFGSFLAGIITPRAHKHMLEPKYGPTFFIAALLLLAASIFASYELPSRYIFYFSTAALGVQNGIASIYSANLIRCTLTGTSTDLGLIFAQALRGNFEKFIRGTLIAIIVTNYWIGGIIAVPIVERSQENALYISVFLFVLLGILCLGYTVKELGVSLIDALLGKWEWKDVLEELFEDHDTEHTVEDFMALFDMVDIDNDRLIDADELRNGLKAAHSKIKLSDFRLKALMRAADTNHDNCIDREEWEELAKKITVKTKKEHA